MNRRDFFRKTTNAAAGLALAPLIALVPGAATAKYPPTSDEYDLIGQSKPLWPRDTLEEAQRLYNKQMSAILCASGMSAVHFTAAAGK